MKVKSDSLFAAALFALFSFGTYQAMIMKDPKGGPTDVGAAFFPFWVCVFIQVLTVLIFIQSVRTSAQSRSDGIIVIKRFLLLTAILCLLFGYIYIMESIGFMISSVIFLVTVYQLLIFFETGRPSPAKQFFLSTLFFSAVSVVLYYLFNTLFRLALP